MMESVYSAMVLSVASRATSQSVVADNVLSPSRS